jgi:glutathione S-transferase
MITVHHLAHSRSQRVPWLLEELGLDYEVKRYERDPDTSYAPPELRAVHPLGKSPVITDGDQVIAESGAIIEYLVEVYGAGRLKPSPGSADARRYTYWLHFAEGSAMPYQLMHLVFQKVRNAPVPFFIKPVARGLADHVLKTFVQPNIDDQLRFMESELAKRPWFAGDAFTAADIQMSFPVEAAAKGAGLGATHPRLADFLARIHSRPAWQRARERGGPYSFAD